MPKLTQPEGKFLSNEDVSTGDVITFIDAGVEREEEDKFKPGKKRLKFEIGVKLSDGTEKVASLNNTSKRNMMEYYSDDSDAWVGKDARVEVVTQKVGSEFKDVVYFTAPNTNLKGEIIVH